MSHGKNRPSSCPQSSEPLTALSSWLVFCGHVKEISQRDFTAALYWNWITCNYILGPTAAEKNKKKALSKKKLNKKTKTYYSYTLPFTPCFCKILAKTHIFLVFWLKHPHILGLINLSFLSPYLDESWHVPSFPLDTKNIMLQHMWQVILHVYQKRTIHTWEMYKKKKDMFITFWRYELLIWQLG